MPATQSASEVSSRLGVHGPVGNANGRRRVVGELTCVSNDEVRLAHTVLDAVLELEQLNSNASVTGFR